MFEDIYNQNNEKEFEDFDSEFDPLDPVEILKEARDEIIRLREENDELWGDARRMARSIKEVSDENPEIIFPGLEEEIEEVRNSQEMSMKLFELITKGCGFKDYVKGKKLDPDEKAATDLLKRHLNSKADRLRIK